MKQVGGTDDRDDTQKEIYVNFVLHFFILAISNFNQIHSIQTKVADIKEPMRGPVAPISIVSESCLMEISQKRGILRKFGQQEICTDIGSGIWCPLN